MEEDGNVSIGGMFSVIKRINTRKGDPMAFATLEDLTGSIEVVFFPRTYQQFQKLLVSDAAVLVKGKLNAGGEEPKIMADEITTLHKKMDGELYIRTDGVGREVLSKIKIILKSYPGPSPVFLYNKMERKLSKTSRDHWVDLSSQVAGELKRLVGTANVKIKEL
jgi:DNA polymerase-3 subunit alpha